MECLSLLLPNCMQSNPEEVLVGTPAALPCNGQGPHGGVHSTVRDLSLLHVAPSKRWSLGPDNTAILELQGNNAHLVKYGHWMTQLCFLEALQSLMMRNKSGPTYTFAGAREIQVVDHGTFNFQVVHNAFQASRCSKLLW